MLYVVAGCTSEGQCVPSEVDFECYLSCLELLLEVLLEVQSVIFQYFSYDFKT